LSLASKELGLRMEVIEVHSNKTICMGIKRKPRVYDLKRLQGKLVNVGFTIWQSRFRILVKSTWQNSQIGAN
jgi:hypothetical protein